MRLVVGLVVVLGLALRLAAAGSAQIGTEPPARILLQRIHAPQSIDEELARLTRDLELSAVQQREVRPLLQAHHDKIGAVLNKNPTATREDLGPQIHALSDETHRAIHALLTDHQCELEDAMVRREWADAEGPRRPR